MQDLSIHHHPIGTFLAQSFDKDRDSFRLKPDQINFFHEQGYISGLRVLTDEQVETLRNELTDLADPKHPGHDLFYEYHSNESKDPDHVLFHALGAWRIKPGFHDLLWNPAFTIPASQLLGGSVRFWHDQLFCKPAHHGGVVAWHQDYSYWTRTQPLAHLTCWIGLDDSTRENGCMQYIPGSHRWPDLPITGLAGDMDAISAVLNAEQRRQFDAAVAVELRKGEASFHHPRLVHGSFANHSEHARRATVVNAMRDGVHSATNESLLHGVPGIPAGEKVAGQFFPLLDVCDVVRM
jgi:ectoine hydroxylase-related dioxygenase (phytanoyl-CoA dioxygenase family)